MLGQNRYLSEARLVKGVRFGQKAVNIRVSNHAICSPLSTHGSDRKDKEGKVHLTEGKCWDSRTTIPYLRQNNAEDTWFIGSFEV